MEIIQGSFESLRPAGFVMPLRCPEFFLTLQSKNWDHSRPYLLWAGDPRPSVCPRPSLCCFGPVPGTARELVWDLGQCTLILYFNSYILLCCLGSALHMQNQKEPQTATAHTHNWGIFLSQGSFIPASSQELLFLVLCKKGGLVCVLAACATLAKAWLSDCSPHPGQSLKRREGNEKRGNEKVTPIVVVSLSFSSSP